MRSFLIFALVFALFLSAAAPSCAAQEDIELSITEYISDQAYAPTPFTDVLGHWAETYITLASKVQYMNGIGSQKFAPDAVVTRAMAVQVLYNLAGQPNISVNTPFRDIPNSAWYKDAIAWAYECGITSGVSEAAFAPEQNVTREQLVAFLYRYSDYMGYWERGYAYLSECASLDRFHDKEQLSTYARGPMLWALGNQIVCGKTASTLDPIGDATRAELAKILVCFAVYTPSTAYRINLISETPQEVNVYHKEGRLPDAEDALYAALRHYGITEAATANRSDIVFECAAALASAEGYGTMQEEYCSEITSSLSAFSVVAPDTAFRMNTVRYCDTQQAHYSALSQIEDILCSSIYFQDCMCASMEMIAQGIYTVAVEAYGYRQVQITDCKVCFSFKRDANAADNSFTYFAHAEINVFLCLQV